MFQSNKITELKLLNAPVTLNNTPFTEISSLLKKSFERPIVPTIAADLSISSTKTMTADKQGMRERCRCLKQRCLLSSCLVSPQSSAACGSSAINVFKLPPSAAASTSAAAYSSYNDYNITFEEGWYRCPFCEMKCIEKSKVRRHMRKHTGETKQEDNKHLCFRQRHLSLNIAMLCL